MEKFEEFARKVENEIRKKAKGKKIELYDILEINGVKKKGLVALDSDNCSPVIYLEEYYQEFWKHGNMEKIIQKIWKSFTEQKTKMNFSNMFQWEPAKRCISVRLVHYEKNRMMLENMPHYRFLEFAVIYYFIGGVSERELMFITVNNQMMERWGIGKTELDMCAKDNYEYFFSRPLINLYSLKTEEEEEMSQDRGHINSFANLYIVTNKMRIYGASAILFPQKLKELADKFHGDVYILPTSVHEVMACSTESDLERLKEFLEGVNDYELLPEEILSYNVYRYYHESGRLETV